MLAEKSKGLIGLSSGFDGAICHFLKQRRLRACDGKSFDFSRYFRKRTIFSSKFRITIWKKKKRFSRQIVELADKTQIPLVATNDAHYINEDDAGRTKF
jgi:DNA polymerase-3 subunit alpha